MHEPTAPQPGEWPVFGHRWAVSQLAQALADRSNSGGPRHAYLFLGPRQIGKSTFVRAFAQALLCTGAQRPCGSCRNCRLLARGAHPDFHLVAPLDKSPDERAAGGRPPKVDRLAGTLYVEQARQLIHTAQLSPVEGTYRFFHIQDAQTANDSFFNALLKTLEEPPSHTIICLTAADRGALLPTVVSRCQVLELHPLDQESVRSALHAGWNVAPEQADLLARLANGRLGWAVGQALRPDLWDERQQSLDQLWSMMAADRVDRLAFAEAMAARSTQLYTTLSLWATWWRDLMLVQAGCSDACSNIDQQAQLKQQASALSPEEVLGFVRRLQHSEELLQETTVNARLTLDALLLRMPQLRI